MSLRISPAQHDDLRKIRDRPIDELEVAYESLRDRHGRVYVRQRLEDALAEKLDKDFSQILSRQLLALSAFRRREGKSTREVVEMVTSGVRDLDWSTEQQERWTGVEEILGRFLDLEAVLIVEKAATLSADYANLYLASRIITDIRPVFDDHRSEILAALVTSVLRLDYYAGESGRRTISMAMERAEVERLRETCDEALAKIDKAQDFIAQGGALAASSLARASIASAILISQLAA